jgi:tetratricopeptide (TPR) repeat protein
MTMTALQTSLVRSLNFKGLASAALYGLAALLLFAGNVIVPGGDFGIAVAQEDDKDDERMSGRRTQALSKNVYDLITQANELVDAEDYQGALKLLDKVKAMPKLSAYETAQLYSFYGFLYFNAERYKEAVNAYNTVLKQPDLPPPLQQQTIRTLSQLAFVTEDYKGAIRYANQYMNDVGPDADMYVVIGTAHYQLEQYKEIIPPVQKAISMYAEQGKGPKEQWLLLLRVAYWELDDYKKVKDTLEQLVVGWPKKDYWTQLSGIYFELKDEPRQLAAYEAAYDQGLLASSNELTQMAQLFMQADVPYKGARVLEKGLESKQIERTVRNLRLLSQAWQLSQEDRKAIPPLLEAAKMSNDGELYARLAQSHLNLGDYKECIATSNQAISKGGLKNTGNAYLILGMCQFEQKSLGSAKASFRKALNYDKVAKNASSWIAYVESEEERLRQLEQSLQRVQEIREGNEEVQAEGQSS